MKTPSNELQELIKTLLPSEKNGFKAYCKSKRDTGTVEYLKLFTIYCGKNVADDNIIKQTHNFKNFTRIKTYLHQQLLNYLADTASSTVEKEMSNMFVVADILFKRALFKQALTVLNKARNLAEKLERFYYCLIIDQKIIIIQNTVRNFEFWDYYINDYYTKEFQPLIDKIIIDQDVQMFATKMNQFQVKKDSLLRTPESFNELNKAFLPLLKKGENYPQSFTSKSQYCIAVGFYYQQFNDFEKAIYYFQQTVELYEKNPQFHSTRYMNYVIYLNNLLYCYATSENFDEMKKILSKLNGISFKDKSHKNYVTQISIHYETAYYKYCVDLPQRKKVLRKLESEFLKQITTVVIPLKIKIISNFSINYFIDGNYKKSLEWLNRLDEFNSNVNYKSYFAIMRLYRLVLYFEMEKHDLLQYSISNTYRSLQHSKLLFKLEKVVIKSLEKLIDQNNSKLREKIFRDALIELDPIKEDPSMWQVLQIFNFVGWLRCKSDGKDFKKLMPINS